MCCRQRVPKPAYLPVVVDAGVLGGGSAAAPTANSHHAAGSARGSGARGRGRVVVGASGGGRAAHDDVLHVAQPFTASAPEADCVTRRTQRGRGPTGLVCRTVLRGVHISLRSWAARRRIGWCGGFRSWCGMPITVSTGGSVPPGARRRAHRAAGGVGGAVADRRPWAAQPVRQPRAVPTGRDQGVRGRARRRAAPVGGAGGADAPPPVRRAGRRTTAARVDLGLRRGDAGARRRGARRAHACGRVWPSDWLPNACFVRVRGGDPRAQARAPSSWARTLDFAWKPTTWETTSPPRNTVSVGIDITP